MVKKRLSFSKTVSGFAPNLIKAAAVERFLRNNPTARTSFETSISHSILNLNINVNDLDKVIQILDQCQIPNSLDSIESIFEALLTDGHVKNLGAVYTPVAVRKFLINESIKCAQKDKKNWIPTILDPACGSAGFLISAAEILNTKYGIPIDIVFNKYIYGIDVCGEAVDNAKCICNLYISCQGFNVSNINIQIFNFDSLLENPEVILSKIGQPHGVDVLCTNPPYVKLQNLSTQYRDSLISKYSSFVKGSFSLAPLFLIQGINLIASSGCLGFITQNNFPTSLSGEYVRKHVQDHGYLSRYIDFGHYQIFEDASAYTCLIFAEKRKREFFEFSSHKGFPSDDSLESLKYSNVHFAGLNSKKWRIGEEDHLRQLAKIESFGTPLGEMTAIRVGFATLKDDVFLIRNNRIQNIEQDVLKSVIKISEFNTQDELKNNDLQILFPYRKFKGRYELIAEHELEKYYPNAYRHLCEHKDDLESRDKGKKSYPAWYAWGRTQGMTAPGPKLLTKTFSHGPNFLLDRTDSIFCNGYSVTPDSKPLFNSPEDELLVIQKILNSNVMQYYSKLTSFQIEGNYQCFQKNFIEKFGMPDIDISLSKAALSFDNEKFNQYLAEKIYGLDWKLIFDYLVEN